MICEEIIFAGFGGQGILTMGKFLAFAGMESGLNVSWLPSYGAEMRGGTANCSVIITEYEIGSPVVTKADTVVVMNKPSLVKFEPYLKKDGLLIMDSDLIDTEPKRKDIKIIKIPAQSIASKLGTNTIANMILLGVLIENTNIVSMDTIIAIIKKHGKEKYYEINKRALLSR